MMETIELRIPGRGARIDNWPDGAAERADEADQMIRQGRILEPISGRPWRVIRDAWRDVLRATIVRRGRGEQWIVTTTAPRARVIIRSLLYWGDLVNAMDPTSNADARVAVKTGERLQAQIEGK